MNTLKYKSLFLLFFITASTVFGQLTLRKTWNGQYDIKLVGSMVLQPAFVSSTSPIVVTGFVTDDMTMRAGNVLTENNDFNGFPSNPAIPENVFLGLPITDPANTMLNGKTCANPGTGELKYNVTNRNVALVYTDCDDDFNTFQSSAAYLDFGNNMSCTEIKAAYLYWSGETGSMCTYGPYPGTATMKSYNGGAVGNRTSTYKKVLFKTPIDNNYMEVNAVRELTLAGINNTVCVADVTDIVKGKPGGLFWVANVQTTSKGSSGVSAGWCLVVLFTPPNCPPRMINLWDGLEAGLDEAGRSRDIWLNNLVTPATKNFKSYMGVGVLDGENIAPCLYGDMTSSMINYPVTKLDGTTVNIPSRIPFETLNFQSYKTVTGQPTVTGDLIRLNPFATDQPYYRFATKNGAPVIYPGGVQTGNLFPSMQDACTNSTFENFQFVPGIDGISSSRITSYDEVTNTNGNEIRRLPQKKYTMGFDAHHFRLPVNALVEGATQAKMTYFSGDQGGTLPFMAYIAIETLQPRLLLHKTSLVQKTQLDQEIEYKLKVENVGGLLSQSGAYITDTLDLPLDFVPGSVQYLYGKTPPQSFEIINQGQDQNEVLKFYLPAIQAANLQVAQDSVVITFKAKVKGLDRIDIWSVGCRRTIRNKATVYYSSSDGETFESGSNSGGGCPGEGQFADVKVDDQTLEQAIIESHNIEAVLTTRVNQNPNLKIVDVIREYLTAAVGQQQALLYTITTLEGDIVSPTATFDTNTAIQRYIASYDMGYECIEVYNFKFTVGKVPKVNLLVTNTSCVGSSDGKITITLTEGQPGFTCKVVNANDASIVYYNAFTPDTETTVQHDVCALPAGNYAIIVGDKGELLVTENVTIKDPLPLTLSINGPNSVCSGSNATLTTTTTGRGQSVPLTYAWKKSTDNTNWDPIPGVTGSSLTQTINEDTYYMAYVCDDACQTSATKQVIASPIPTVVLHQDTTVSITINPTATFIAQVSNYTPPVSSYTWRMSTNNGVSWQNIPATGALGTHTKVNDSTYTVSNITSLAMNGYKYQVSVTDAASCSSTTSVATLTVVEGPAVTHTSVPTKCSDSSDGELHFTISAGETAQEYSVTLYTGSGYSDANQPSSPAVSSLSPNFVGGSTRTLDVTGLASGQYSLILRPVGGLPGLKNYYTTYTVTAPSAIVASVSGKTMICTGSQVSLSSQVSGGTVGGTRSYLWQESNDGVTFSDINTEVTPSLTATVNNDVYYRLQTMVNGHCPTYSAAHFVTALPVPVVETLLTDSGCYAFDLTNFHAVETSGISNYSLTLHYGMPSSATDNRFLIPSNNYLLREDQKKPFKFVNRQWPIFARMSVQDLCYGVGVTTIYIKDIDLCSPIIISKFFSPDGDGINELFQIEGLQDYSSPEIFIYDRYGKLVFSGNAASVTPPNGWDGKYLGRPLPSDDYWYVIKLIETKNKIGNFSLKRKKE
jgi:gliding motility-associated-like protein/uncharacterized repeat protein (TIGR01451 family)